MKHTGKHILLVTRNFPPMTGGIERLTYHLYKSLSAFYYFSIIGPPGGQEYANTKDDYIPCSAKKIPLFLAQSLALMPRASRHHDFSYCIASSGLSAPQVQYAAKISGCPAIVLAHGLDVVVQNRLYKRYFLPKLLNSDAIIANSTSTERLIHNLKPDAHTQVINPGIELPVVQTHESRPVFRKLHNLQNKKILLSVGRLVPRKGIMEFIEQSLPILIKKFSDIVLVIVGPESYSKADHKKVSYSRIKETVQRMGLQEHVLLAGCIDDTELTHAYTEADALVFPTLQSEHDIEGFGMVAIEAAAHGTPTVAFASGGVIDAVSSGRSGLLITPGDYTALNNGIRQLFEGEYPEITPEHCREFAQRFSWEHYRDQFLSVLRRLDTQR